MNFYFKFTFLFKSFCDVIHFSSQFDTSYNLKLKIIGQQPMLICQAWWKTEDNAGSKISRGAGSDSDVRHVFFSAFETRHTYRLLPQRSRMSSCSSRSNTKTLWWQKQWTMKRDVNNCLEWQIQRAYRRCCALFEMDGFISIFQLINNCNVITFHFKHT